MTITYLKPILQAQQSVKCNAQKTLSPHNTGSPPPLCMATLPPLFAREL